MARQTICSVEGCGNPHLAKKFCTKHYARMRKHGHPTNGGEEKGKQLRWIEKYRDYQGDDCVLWQYAVRVDGYGLFKLKAGDRNIGAHRAMCIAAHGEPEPERNIAAHSCGIPLCTNPRHLRWANQKENCADMVGHGTVLEGEKNAEAKLTTAQVQEIKGLRGIVTQKEIAKLFGISQTQVSRIQTGRSWRFLV